MAERRRIALLSPAVGSHNVGDTFIELAVRRLLGANCSFSRFSIRQPLSDDDAHEINEHDIAVLCGTNLYQREWECALTRRQLDLLTVPVVPIGVGSSAASLDDTAVGPETLDMIVALHERCAVGSVRDPHSLAVVRAAGVNNVELTGCPVLFWAGGPRSIRAEPRHRLIVTARNWLMHRWPDPVDNPVQLDLVRAVLAAFGDVELVFAVHEDFDDSLIDAVGLDERNVFRSDDPAAFVELYTDPSAVVLGLRLHAAMLALANGAPPVLVGHDTRTYSFCQMLHLPWIELFDDAAVDDTIGALRRALSGDVAALEPSYTVSAELAERTRAFLGSNDLPADGLP